MPRHGDPQRHPRETDQERVPGPEAAGAFRKVDVSRGYVMALRNPWGTWLW